MRVGVFGLTAPKSVDPNKALEWAIVEAARLEAHVLGWNPWPSSYRGGIAFDLSYWKELRVMARNRNVEIEPYVRSPFDLVRDDAAAARRGFLESVRGSKILGGPVLRTGYGDQTLARTRFAKRPLAEHLKFLEANLREAAKIAESEGVTLAIENHTDFSGREWDQVFSLLDSRHIRCALDTGNGMTIFCDALDDAAALARWTVTTHVKDLAVIENPRPAKGPSPRVPFGLVGCPIGEGSIDLLEIISRLFRESPLHDNVPLIVEPSWPVVRKGEDIYAIRHTMLTANLRNLRKLLSSVPDERLPVS